MRLPANWTTYAAVGVALLLGGYVALFEMGDDARLLPAETGAVQRLTVAGPERGPVRLTRADGQWRIESPLAWPADRLTVEELLRRLTRAEPKRELGPLEGDAAARYGLTEPYRRFTLHTREGEHELRLGAETPLGGARYATTGERVVTLDRGTVATLDTDLTDLRGKQVLTFEPDTLQAITVADEEGGTVRLARGEHGGWRMAAPLADDASDAAVRRLLTDLSGLRARAFHDGVAPESAELGLDRPRWRLRLEREGDQAAVTVRLARREGGAGDREARAAERYVAATPAHPDTAFDVRFSALSPHRGTVLQLLERQLTDVRAPQIDRLTVRRSDGPDLTLERSDDASGQAAPAWRTADGSPVALSAMRRLARALRGLRAASAEAEGSVAQPVLTLTAERLGRDAALRLRLGPHAASGAVPAAVDHRQPQYTLPAEQVAGLRKALAALTGNG